MARENRWHYMVIALCMLSLLWAATPSYSADPDFGGFTKGKPFQLNTLPTTQYGPPWADILVKPENFLQCKGGPIALCYYSGPEGSVTPCQFTEGQEVANCTCYEIPGGPPYFVDINAILNLDVYLDTIKMCGDDGGNCLPRGPHSAPVCDAINKNTLIPGADLISTFSFALERKNRINQSNCETPALYAGCMTAPCKKTGRVDPATHLPLVQCACPTYDGPYQVGQDLSKTGQQCVLGDDFVWSAAYAPLEGGSISPIPPTPPDCLPDAPGASGCPLLSPNPPVIPQPPSNVSCKEVCSEYRKSNDKGIEIGFTCDATLCTATETDFDLVQEACSGLGKSSISEILKLETEVGLSCAASQICGCEPKKATNEEISKLNARQRVRGISPQCDLNGTLCGSQP